LASSAGKRMTGSYPKKTVPKFRFCRNGVFEAIRKLHVDFETQENRKEVSES